MVIERVTFYAQDLDQLKFFTQDQTASRLCIDENGHLWTQKTDVNFLIEFCQLICRLLYEHSFESEDCRINFLVEHVQELLAEALDHASIKGVPAHEIEELKKSFNKDSFKTELRSLQEAQNKVRQIQLDHSLTPEKMSEEFEKLELLSNLSSCFLKARECLLLPMVVAPIVAQIAQVPDLEEVVEVEPSPVVAIPIQEIIPVKRKPINYFKEIRIMTKQLLDASDDAESKLKIKADGLVNKPTAENLEKLKGILAGTMDYYLAAHSEDEKQRAVDFGNIISSKILTMNCGADLINELATAENQPFIQSLTLGVFALLIKNNKEEQIQPLEDISNAPFYDVTF